MNKGAGDAGMPFMSGSRLMRMPLTRSTQRAGEQMRWNDFASRRSGLRDSWSRRSFGVRYLNAARVVQLSVSTTLHRYTSALRIRRILVMDVF